MISERLYPYMKDWKFLAPQTGDKEAKERFEKQIAALVDAMNSPTTEIIEKIPDWIGIEGIYTHEICVDAQKVIIDNIKRIRRVHSRKEDENIFRIEAAGYFDFHVYMNEHSPS